MVVINMEMPKNCKECRFSVLVKYRDPYGDLVPSYWNCKLDCACNTKLDEAVISRHEKCLLSEN